MATMRRLALASLALLVACGAPKMYPGPGMSEQSFSAASYRCQRTVQYWIFDSGLYRSCMEAAGARGTPSADGGQPLTLDELRVHNRESLGKVSPGMTAAEVTEIMGPWYAERLVDLAPERITNPYRVERFRNTGGEQVEVLYYYTEIKRRDAAISDDELTPVIFVEGQMVAVGWRALESVPVIEIRQR